MGSSQFFLFTISVWWISSKPKLFRLRPFRHPDFHCLPPLLWLATSRRSRCGRCVWIPLALSRRYCRSPASWMGGSGAWIPGPLLNSSNGSVSSGRRNYDRLIFCPFSKNSRPPPKILKPTFCRKLNAMEATYTVAKKLKEFLKELLKNLAF